MYFTIVCSKLPPFERRHFFLCYLNIDDENHFLMNAPEVSEQQLSKHDRQDSDRAIECTTEINDSKARVDKDRTDLFTPYWMYLGNGARHRSLSIIAISIPLFHRTKFLRLFVARVHNGLFRGSYVTFFDLPPQSFLCRVVVDMIEYIVE